MAIKTERQLCKPPLRAVRPFFSPNLQVHTSKSHFSKSVRFGAKRKLMTCKSHRQLSKPPLAAVCQFFGPNLYVPPKIVLFEIGRVWRETRAYALQKPPQLSKPPLRAFCQFFGLNLQVPPKLYFRKSVKFGTNL